MVKIQNAIGAGADVSFDCVGFDKTMTMALDATRAGGKVCLVGLGQSEMNLPLTPAATRYAILIVLNSTYTTFNFIFFHNTYQSTLPNTPEELPFYIFMHPITAIACCVSGRLML